MYNDTIQPFILTQANSISYKTKVFLGLLAVALSLNFSPRQVSAEIYGQYVSSQTCTECHTEISQLWSKTPHAKAYDSLLSSGQQDLPACLQCHVVGYGETGGYLDQELTLELAGVQCESCHGPGKRHINTLDETHNIIRSPTEKDCRNCHTVGQDPHFDFQNKVTLVHNKETTGDSKKQVEPSPSRVNSTLSTDKTTHELGRIQEGKPAIVYTRVLNAGEETIHITDVISS